MQISSLSLIAKIYLFFSGLLFIYLILPGPKNITNFPPLPNSMKSTLEGDTIQVPNVSAYFSNFYRQYATNYYRNFYHNQTFLPFPPIRLNYPPEFAFTAIKDQTQSTYLEEFVYPLRDSLFVNGFEPFYENNQPKFWGATKFEIGQLRLDTKVTLRYYPSSVWVRLLVWIGVNASIILLWKMSRQV